MLAKISTALNFPIVGMIIFFGLVKFLLHMLTANYGFFCDELYTIALSKHLALGYVDLPPLVPLLAAASRFLLGESLSAHHSVPALAGAGTLVFACLITKELGGGKIAIAISALSFIIVPIWLIMDSFFCYDCIDQLFLSAFLWVLVKFLRSGNQKQWLVLGLLAGLACLSKTTILYLGPGFLIALLISTYRRHLLTPWPWLGAGIFLLVVSPYLLWQLQNHWPTLEWMNSYSKTKVYHYNLQEFLVNLVLTMNPLLIPLLCIGLVRILKRFGGFQARFLGIAFLVTTVLIFSLYARIFMLVALFIPIIAAASIWIEESISNKKWRGPALAGLFTYLAIGGCLVAPASLPILPLESLHDYAQTFGWLYQPVKDFNYEKGELPWEFSSRIGWEDMVKSVADVYNSLPAEERSQVGIYAEWFGPAGAIDYFGPAYGLPPAVSGHMNYYLWGPGENSWEEMILVTNNPYPFQQYYHSVEIKTVILNPYGTRDTRPKVYLAKNPSGILDLHTFWESLKLYY